MATTTRGSEAAVDEWYAAMSDFAQGNSKPAKVLCSHRDDMLLANPFGPAIKGWTQVEPAFDYAGSRFSDGEVRPAERIATYVSGDLAAIHEVEHWNAKVGGADPAPFDLRVTSIYRLEEGEWKLVLRHADPISTANDQGPLRTR